MYNPVIFDLDGTLLNTIGDLAAAGNYALARMGFPTHTEDEFRLFVGNGIPKLIERMLPKNASAEERETANAIFGEYYGEHKADRTKPYGGMAELLAELKSLGVIAVCNTNKDHSFSVELLRSFFGGSLAESVGAGVGYSTKPDPGAARYLAEKYRCEGFAPLYVGDSDVDMQTAFNAGMDACGVLWGFRGRELLERQAPAHIAESVSDLRRVILGI